MIRLLLFCFLSFAPMVEACAQYRHKSEAEIAAMTPTQRVDEYANEQAYHQFNFPDEQVV